MTSDDLVETSVEEDHVHRARAVYAKDQGLLDVGGPAGAALQLPGVQGTSFDHGAVVRGNVIHDAGGVGIYPDVGADWVTVQHNVVFNQYNALSSVNATGAVVNPIRRRRKLPHAEAIHIGWCTLTGMRTNIEIDDTIIAEVQRLTGAPSKRAAVDLALRELVARHRRLGILDLRGKIQWEGDLEQSRMGRE